MAKILVVDDQESFLSLIAQLLTSRRYDVTALTDGQCALEKLSTESFELVICDINMQPVGGMSVLRWIREHHAELPVVMLTGYGSVETAQESLTLGAFDYITKPFEMADVLWTVERALAKPEAAAPQMAVPDIQYVAGDLVVHSLAMRAALGLLRRLAPTSLPLLITGEPGVGKRRVARAMQALSGRPSGAYYMLDCADLGDGSRPSRPEAGRSSAGAEPPPAPGGSTDYTLCLVHAERLPMAFQMDLLQLLEPRNPPFSAATAAEEEPPPRVASPGPRIIATTSVDLARQVSEGRFSRKLHERLRRFTVHVPALRDRREDILPLAYDVMLQKFGAALLPMMDLDVRGILEQHDWPGNICELQAVVGQVMARQPGTQITRAHLPDSLCQHGVTFVAGAVRDVRAEARGHWLRRFLNEHVAKPAMAGPATKRPRAVPVER